MLPEDGERQESRHASEYLANERTFLAWVRTSIAVVSPPTTTGTSLHVGVGMMANTLGRTAPRIRMRTRDLPAPDTLCIRRRAGRDAPVETGA
jgi:hypothetical protein